MRTSDPPAPLAVQVNYDALHQRLDSGGYVTGDRLPTEREIGEEFGVSRLTVAKAMAQLVCEGRVQRFRGRGTFVTDDPRETQRGDTQRGDTRPTQVTFISPGRQGQPVLVSHGILEGLHAVLGEAGYYVGVDFYDDLERHRQCLARYDRPEMAAFAIWPETGPRARAAIEALIEARFPFVFVDTYLPELDSDHVTSDNVEGAALMVSHLVGLGHRRIAYLAKPATRTSTIDRLTGFLRGALNHGLSVGSDNVIQVSAEDGSELERRIHRLFDGDQPPTALFCAQDHLAISAYWVLRERGLQVPRDVSLAGYDDIDLAQRFVVPLTTIRQGYFEMGRVAGEILLDRLTHESALHCHQSVPPRLMVRDSTAGPPAAAGLPGRHALPKT